MGSFSRNDVQTTTQPDDIVLYSSKQLVIFFGSNSWSYTKLGHAWEAHVTREQLVTILHRLAGLTQQREGVIVMAMITLILMMSVLMWYIVDRFKPLWAGAKYNCRCGAVCGSALLYLLAAFTVNAARPWRLGIVLTALVLMSGSSAAAEVIAKFKKLNTK